MKVLIALVSMIFLLSCSNGDKKKFQMYELSPMAQLMETMYSDHESIKSKLQQGDQNIGTFPSNYLDIYTAKFTKESFNTPEFQTFAKAFIAADKALFTASDSVNRINAYNNAINSCINCHETVGCKGPLTRIRKLTIKP